MSVDVSEVRAFAADVTRMPGELSRHLTPTLMRGGVQIKESMRSDLEASSNGGIRAVGRTVSFDLNAGSGFMEVEVGPEKPDGALANIAYFGTSRGGGHTRDPAERLEEEAERFEKALGDIVEEVWG